MKVLLFLLGIVLCYGLPSLGGYQSIDITEAQSNAKIQNLIQTGLQQIIEDGLQKESFTSTKFVLTKINSVFRQITQTENFKFNCQFDNDEDITVVASFEVQTSVSINSNSTVTSFSYQVTKRTVIQTVDSSYKELSSTEIQYSQEVQDALNYGVAQVVEKSVQEGSLPNLTFQIQQVNSVYRQIVDSSLFYKCNVNLQAEVNVTVTVAVTFTVYYQPISAASSVVDYSCTVKDQEENESEFTVTTEIIGPAEDQYTPLAVGDMQDDSEIKDVMEYGCEQVNKIAVEEKRIPVVKLEIQAVLEAYSQVVGNGLFYKFICKLGDGKSVSMTATFTVHYQITTNEKSLTQCSYETEHDSNDEDSGESEVEMGDVEFGNIDGGLPEDIDTDVEVEVDVDVPELTGNNIEQEILLNSIMEFGIDIIIKQGIKDSKIPKDDYTSSNLISSSQDSTDKGTLYRLECEVTNANMSTVINMSFTVYYQFSSGRKTMSSYSYTVNTVDTTTPETPVKPIDGEYTVCGEEEVQNDTVIQTVLNYGASQIYMIGLLKGQLYISEFNIASVVSVWRQVTVNGGNYKCEIVMENENKVIVNANFMVSYQSSTNQAALSDYDFTVNENAMIDDVETELDIEAETEIDMETTVSDEYVELEDSEIQSDAEVQDVLAFGVDKILQKGYHKNKIPVSEYKITQINSVSRKVQDNGKTYYKCDIELEDVNEVLIKAQFTVSIRTSTQKKSLRRWSYHVSNIKTSSTSTKPVDTAYTEVNKTEAEYSSEIQGCLNFAVQEVIQQSEQYTSTVINSVYRQVVESSLYYKFDVELSNDQGKTVNLACTVSYKPDIDLKAVKAYSYKIKTVSTSTSSQASNSYSYTQIETSQVTSDSKYQGLLDYGVKECVQKLSDYKVVLTTDFEVSEVLSAFTQATTDGENCRFKARLASASKGIYLDVNINVNYNVNTDTKVLTSYSVEGSSEGVSDVLVVDSPQDNDDEFGVGSCKKVASEEVDVDSEVQGAINYGLDSIVGEIVTKENIETDDFEVKEVKRVYREVVNSQNYRVEATLKNSKGTNIDCSFSVNYQSSSDVKQVVSYSYITY